MRGIMEEGKRGVGVGRIFVEKIYVKLRSLTMKYKNKKARIKDKIWRCTNF